MRVAERVREIEGESENMGEGESKRRVREIVRVN